MISPPRERPALARGRRDAARSGRAWRASLAGLVLGLALVAPGCAQNEISYFSATVSEQIRTVVTVEWTTTQPCLGHVDYGPDTSYPWQAPEDDEPSTEHRSVLIGLRSDTTYAFRMVCSAGTGKPLVSPDESVTTGPLPSLGSSFAPTEASLADASGHILLPTIRLHSDDQPGPPVVMFDPQGEVVWYAMLPEGRQASRARVSRDRRSVLFNLGGDSTGQGEDDTSIVRMAWDGTVLDEIPMPYMHHDFVELEDGTVAAIARIFDELGPGEHIAWDVIVEVTPDGRRETVFSGADHAEEDLGVHLVTTPEPQEPGMYRSTPSLNTLEYRAEDDAYYFNVSYAETEEALELLRAPVRFDRETREVAWILGGPRNSFTIDGSDELPWVVQHGMDVTDDSVVAFANNTPTEDCSQVIELGLDMDAMVAETIWTWQPPECRYVPALGTAQRLSGGNTLVVWSTRGIVSEIRPDGEVQFELRSGFGTAFGYGRMVEDLRAPR